MVLFLTSLSDSGRCSPWADDAVGIAQTQLETAFGSYVGAHSVPVESFHLDGIDRDLAAGPFVWSDVSLVFDKVSEVGVAGAAGYAHTSGESWFNRWWAHLDLLPPLADGGSETCRLYCSILGSLQLVQRAEI